MGFKVGVTSGLYTIARSEELATTIRKVGYALTRGTSVIEISADVPHEVTRTDGEQLRYLARKQGINLLLHGSLTVPMCMPERGEYRDAHDHMQKSVRSAVFSGCEYVLFHSCLHIWLELMTYAGRKLTMSFCDHHGRFISEILKENKDLREWFVENRSEDYVRDILLPEEVSQYNSRYRVERTRVEKEIDAIKESAREHAVRENGKVVIKPPEISVEKADQLINDKHDELARLNNELMKKTIRDKLARGGKWDSIELRAIVGILDGYHIMAHYMFYTKDPLLTEMSKLYGIDVDYSDKDWVDKKWEDAEKVNDRNFKEFFYGVVGAKFLEGHIQKLLEWIDDEFIKELDDPELKRIAKKLKVTIELPDARDPAHAGLHILWRPKQVYSVIKNIRKVLKTDRVWMTMDFEHVATQGLDPIREMEETIKTIPDIGKYVISVHSNAPNPMHGHEPLELGDIRIYKLLWTLRKTGMGKEIDTYLVFERGGGQDPFANSVEVLKLCKDSLEKDIEPENLPLEFFGMKGRVAGDFSRQKQIIQDHAFEPMKDLLEIPEEEWTMLSSTVMKKGKRPEVWKKGETR